MQPKVSHKENTLVLFTKRYKRNIMNYNVKNYNFC